MKGYEEYRLKEMYDIILKDGGRYTKFDKTYLVKPEGYDFVLLKDPSVKLHAKNKKYIIGRPNFTSAIRVNDNECVSCSFRNSGTFSASELTVYVESAT